jgi:hypothetical protein
MDGPIYRDGGVHSHNSPHNDIGNKQIREKDLYAGEGADINVNGYSATKKIAANSSIRHLRGRQHDR